MSNSFLWWKKQKKKKKKKKKKIDTFDTNQNCQFHTSREEEYQHGSR